MISSRLTGRARTTIPRVVRAALRLQEGDEIAYVIESGRVVLTRARPGGGDPFGIFSEWDSTADAEAYAGL